MNFSNWLTFCSVAFLVALTPGPAVLLAITNSVAVGPRRAMISSLGNVVGLFIVSAVAMAGMGVVLATSAAAFTVLKLAGAAYLIYLGIKQWRSKASPILEVRTAKESEDQSSAWRLFGHGITIALTNPKSILFFSALFPQFITHNSPVLGQFAVLTTTFAACAVVSHVFYVLLARALKNYFTSPTHTRLFNRVSGGAFVILGLSLLRWRNKAA